MHDRARLHGEIKPESDRVTDSELHREVALKILPETVATDPLLMARFQREGQMRRR